MFHCLGGIATPWSMLIQRHWRWSRFDCNAGASSDVRRLITVYIIGIYAEIIERRRKSRRGSDFSQGPMSGTSPTRVTSK